jgi:hypothetical protein
MAQLPLSDLPLFHLAPVSRLESIMSDGLQPGRLSNISTTGFRDSQHWIHVCDSCESAILWISGNKLLAERTGVREWSLIAIDPRGTWGAMYPDPASSTGYVLPDDRVLPQFLHPSDNPIIID